ncbi:MAG TPA: hypothetical protein VN948_07445 [Terriglobales bacterium]|nr:hypothetical protein [Terriglobales bacterium]
MSNDLQELAWKYFELHAGQRLTIFNFYIALCSAIAAGLVATFGKDFSYPNARILLGLLLVLFSFVFWKLDDRTKLLIKNAEAALEFYEEQDGKEILVTHVFRREKVLTAEKRSSVRLHLSYSKCFNIVFTAFALLGVGTLIWELRVLIHF